MRNVRPAQRQTELRDDACVSPLPDSAGEGAFHFDLDGPSEAVAKQFARHLLHRRLIADDEFGDCLILAQASLAQVPLLATDKDLLDIDEGELLLALNDADLLAVRPAHPKRLSVPYGADYADLGQTAPDFQGKSFPSGFAKFTAPITTRPGG